jgi:transcriptional regulator with XRE-family HTH domain
MDRTGWKQKSLELKSGVRRQAIAQILAGEQDPRDGTVAKLAEAMAVPPPRIVLLDAEGNPNPLWPAPDPATEVAMKVGRAVANAIQETIEKNELWYPGPALRDLIASLYTLASDFTARDIDTSDIHAAISYLQAKQKPPPGGSS